MTYEKVKSIILTILVVTSLLLTWNLWTYQPNYDKLEHQETVKKVSLSTNETKAKEIVLPDQVIFHTNNSYYGTGSKENLNVIMEEIGQWNFNELVVIPWESPSSLVKQNNTEMVHILYPDAITSDLFKSMYAIKQDDFPSFNFDQIIIRMPDREDGVVHFISQKENIIYKCNISLPNAENFRNGLFNEVTHYDPYFPFPTDSGKILYLPQNETELDSYRYLAEEVEIEKLKNALFSDPNLVQESPTSTGYVYTDVQNIMKEDKKNNMIYYEDLGASDSERTYSDDLLQQSIKFISGHGGWTDSYRFVELNEDDKTVKFRIYDSKTGYPVFYNHSIEKLKVVWGKEDVINYERNNFDIQFKYGPYKRTLESGHHALEHIKQKEENYDSALLQDVTIGYTMSMNNETTLVGRLEPSWYYLYDGDWKQLNDAGGDKVGLE